MYFFDVKYVTFDRHVPKVRRNNSSILILFFKLFYFYFLHSIFIELFVFVSKLFGPKEVVIV